MLARSSNLLVEEDSIILDFKLVRDQESFSKQLAKINTPNFAEGEHLDQFQPFLNSIE